MTTKHTPGPWHTDGLHVYPASDTASQIPVKPRICKVDAFHNGGGNMEANASLIAEAPTLLEEMIRFLPVIERAESDPEVWKELTHGLGIATSNSYRAAIAKAKGTT